MEFMRLGNYVLREKLASGGMADIYRAAREGVMGVTREVCIKRIKPALGVDPDFVAMFIDEARIASQLRHANVVAVEDFGEAEGALYLVMEWVHGVDAAALLRRAMAAGRAVPVDAAVWLVAELLRGLAYAHRKTDEAGRWLQIVHRDVSPHNVLVSYEGGVKLTDFGIAKATSRLHETRGEVIKGKLAYMAPEQAVGGAVDARVDVWAAGVVLWEVLTGERPFRGATAAEVIGSILTGRRPPLASLRPDAPAELAAIVERMLSADPGERFPSAAAGQALEATAAWASGGRALGDFVRGLYAGEAFSTLDSHPALTGEALALAPTGIAPALLRPRVTAPTKPLPAAVVTAFARPRPLAATTAAAPEAAPLEEPAVTAAARPAPRGAEPIPATRAHPAASVRNAGAATGAEAPPPEAPASEPSENTLGPIAVVRAAAPATTGRSQRAARGAALTAAGLAVVGALGVTAARLEGTRARAGRAARGGVATVAGGGVVAGPNGLEAAMHARVEGATATADAGASAAAAGTVDAGARGATARADAAGHGAGHVAWRGSGRPAGTGVAVVEVETIPWCNLVIDRTWNVYEGHTIQLSPGEHTIACTQDNRRYTTETLTVRAGERRRLRIVAPGESL